MNLNEINEFLCTQFPYLANRPIVETADSAGIRVRLPFHERSLRPGGTIAGPSIMLLADTVAYAALLSDGDEAVQAVTSNLNINFLRRPEPGDLVGISRLRKKGRRLSVINVTIEDHLGRVVADASVTYAMA